ncbi:MAG: hypothetical protein HY894_04055 [Deltaproteobacteria bacterium]|nr:hypothetical protein [Deltaproteobacteria bacterium]
MKLMMDKGLRLLFFALAAVLLIAGAAQAVTPMVDGGLYHSVLLNADGTVWAWGWNGYGELGDGTTTDRLTPVQVSGLTGVVSVAAGFYYSLALKSDGTVWAWGYNYYGQLGDGITTSRYTPVQVSGLTGVVSVAAGGYHSLAVNADGTVWAWGYNVNSQLGDGTMTDRYTPVQVALTTSSSPDLVVSALSGPGSAVRGTTITVNNTVANTRWAAASVISYANLYLSTDTVLDAGDVYLGQRYTPVLLPGASNAKATLVRIPSTVATGNYFIIVQADATNTNAESDEANNTAVAPITITRDVDLTVAATVPSQAIKGVAFNVPNTVSTTGFMTAAPSYVKFYLSADAALDGGDVLLGQRYAGPVTAFAPSTMTKSLTIPAATPAGNYYVIAVADATNTNAETNEGNNAAAYPIRVYKDVDLAVSVLTVPASVVRGTGAATVNTVRNNGTSSSSASYVRFYLSMDTVIDPAHDLYIGQRQIAGLAGGASSGATNNLWIPGYVPTGTYYIGAIADATNTNAETNETNNVTVSGPVTVTQ